MCQAAVSVRDSFLPRCSACASAALAVCVCAGSGRAVLLSASLFPSSYPRLWCSAQPPQASCRQCQPTAFFSHQRARKRILRIWKARCHLCLTTTDAFHVSPSIEVSPTMPFSQVCLPSPSTPSSFPVGKHVRASGAGRQGGGGRCLEWMRPAFGSGRQACTAQPHGGNAGVKCSQPK